MGAFLMISPAKFRCGVMVDIVVRNGVADLWGTVYEPEQARALRPMVKARSNHKS